MPLNFGYIGVGKEATKGTAVAPTFFFRASRPVAPMGRAEIVEVPNIAGYGISDVVPAARHAEADLSLFATPRAIGALLTGLMGAPNTSGSAPNYTHIFTPKAAVPTYTVEGQTGVGIYRMPGSVVNGLEFSHAANGLLEVTARLVGRDKVSQSTAATPSVEADYFLPVHVAVSVDGQSLQAVAEDLRLTLSLEKEVIQTFGAPTPYDILPTGEGELTLEATVIYDATLGANWLNRFTNATAMPVVLRWQRDANTSLEFSFQGFFGEDPINLANQDLKTARVRLNIRGRIDSLTVTLKNGQASY